MADDANPIALNRAGLIGKPIDRVEGKLKVSGTASYAHEVMEIEGAAHGYLVGATIPRGRIAAVDISAAEAAPGVLLVWTYKNAPAQPAPGTQSQAGSQAPAQPELYDERIRFYGQTAALVVAETFEQAVAAARLVRIDYEADPGAAVMFEDMHDQARDTGGDEEAQKGDFDAAFAAAPAVIDETWTTPIQNHCQMEPHASISWWEGDEVYAFTSNQSVKRPQHALGETMGIDRNKAHIRVHYVGGGFGGKNNSYADLTLSALAARELKRPVKIALTRQQMFHMTIHRPATVQRVRLAAERDGRLTGIAHETISHCARADRFMERASAFTKNLYAAPNRRIGHRLALMDLPVAGAMRAPGEAVGMLALECAMDELAEQLGMDPVDLRILNEPDVDPTDGKPFSTRPLVRCLKEGAQAFGWNRRNPKPRQTRDGRWWVGLGMAAAIRGNFLLPAKAQIHISAEGIVTVRQAMTDIGTGTYTILAQIAAETLGVPLEEVRIELGHSEWAPAPGSGGSFGAASAGSAAMDAGINLRSKLAVLAVGDAASPLHGADPAKAEFRDGNIVIGNQAEALGDLVRRASPQGVDAVGAVTPDPKGREYSQHTYGGHFCEVGVDAVTGEVRVRRMIGVFAAGRILNHKTARSQLTGGMIWGIGGALHEENHVDPRFGSFVAQDLAQYHVPAQADIAGLDAWFIDEVDDIANPLGIKGVGELGICGAGAAVANAVYNACGVRVRDYPITVEKVLAGLP